MAARFGQLRGINGFLLIWITQVVSILTSSMSSFALSIWVFEKTGSATALSLVQVFFITPFLIVTPFAGVLVDRYNRKLMMAVSDLVSFVATASILVLNATGSIQVCHLYAASVLFGLGNAFQWPAYSAVISTIISKEQLGRANGLMSLMESGPGVVAPLLAGALLPVISLTGILGMDVATFFLALGGLLLVFIPKPAVSAGSAESRGSFFKEASFGFKFIFKRQSLLAIQSLFLLTNLFFGIGFAVIAPMVLAKTGNNSVIYGSTRTAAALGAVAGGVIMSAWGGFKKRINGVLVGMALPGVLGLTIFGLGSGLPVWIPAAVMMSIAGPLCNASNQAIWQAKVPQDMQGRVFSARRLIAWIPTPIAPLIGGLMADYLLEPAMRTSTGLAKMFGGLVGTGVGTGMGLLMLVCGVLATLSGLSGYLFPIVRNVESILPDQIPETPAAAPEVAVTQVEPAS